MKIQELPLKIRGLALQRQEAAGNSGYAHYADISNPLEAFPWQDTPEGQEFWEDIARGNFDSYERMYPGLISVPVLKAPAHYDNSNGSLYKVASERKWNPYVFDVVKRLERGGKKDPLRQEIEKSIYVLQLWLEEIEDEVL